MSEINYSNRFFRPVWNSETGEVSSETIFHYGQKDGIVWGTYQGGAIKAGKFFANILENGELDMKYQHENIKGEYMTGVCRSRPEILPDGRIRLYEKWQWTCGDFSSGESIVEEIETPV
jgi:hypothetical protein